MPPSLHLSWFPRVLLRRLLQGAEPRKLRPQRWLQLLAAGVRAQERDEALDAVRDGALPRHP